MVQARPDGQRGQAGALPVCAAQSPALLPREGDDRDPADVFARRSSLPVVDVAGAAAGGLDLHEELSTPRVPDPRRGGCLRWPERMWLLASDGVVVPGRCNSPNLCDYCARLTAVENTEMLALDAMDGDAPEVWMVLTTSIATLDMSVFYEARRKLLKAIARRCPSVQYAALLEFTTGYGARSGGKRRPHWNLLLKGVTADDLAVVRELVNRIWCPRVGAKPQGQYVGEISDAGGLMRYIALHFQKASQAPPKGFRGQRFNCSRGYFTSGSVTAARERARESLRSKRDLYAALAAGHEGLDAELDAARRTEYRRSLEWRLYTERHVSMEPNRQATTLDVAQVAADMREPTLPDLQRLAAAAEPAEDVLFAVADGVAGAVVRYGPTFTRPTEPPAPNARDGRVLSAAMDGESRAVVRDHAAPPIPVGTQ